MHIAQNLIAKPGYRILFWIRLAGAIRAITKKTAEGGRADLVRFAVAEEPGAVLLAALPLLARPVSLTWTSSRIIAPSGDRATFSTACWKTWQST